MPAVLLSEPHWSAAARALVSGCVDLRHEDDVVALLESVCQRLGDALYPAFLRLLCEVGQHGDHTARVAVARALVTALRSGRLPSGRLQAWGGHAPALRIAAARSLGPIEYLCAWYGQIDLPVEQQRREFLQSAESIMALVESDDTARALYCEKLQADASDPLEGALSRRARCGVEALASAWAGGAPPAVAAQRFLNEVSAAQAHGRQLPARSASLHHWVGTGPMR